MKKLKNLFQKALKRKKRTAAIIIVLGVIGFLVYQNFFASRNQLKSAKIEQGNVTEELILSGTIEATEHIELTFETSGQITYVGVSEGDEVKKGQILAKLDTTSLNSAYQRALADLRAAEATVEKIHDDVKDHASDETYAQKDTRTTAEVAKDKAYEAVIAAERALRGATIKTPFDGIVTYIANPFSGANTIYTQTQFEVVNPETIYFRVLADQTEVIRMKEGHKVSIILDAFLNKEIKGSISEISFSPDKEEVGVVYEVKITLEDLKQEVADYRLGMTGDATFVLNEVKDALWVPPEFIKSDKQGKYLLVNAGKKKVYINVGVEGSERIEVKGDINKGDTVYD